MEKNQKKKLRAHSGRFFRRMIGCENVPSQEIFSLFFFLQLPRFSFHFSVMWTNSCETSLRLSLMQEGITGHRPWLCLFPSVQNNGSPFWAQSPHPANSLLSRWTGRWKSLQLNELNCLCVEDTGLKKKIKSLKPDTYGFPNKRFPFPNKSITLIFSPAS